MAGQYWLGNNDVVPIAAGVGLAFRDASAIAFCCTGNDTFTLTSASSFGGSYTNLAVITLKYTNAQTNGTAAWVKATQAAAATVTIASGAVLFAVLSSQMTDPANYIKVSAGGSGLVTAIYDLDVRRTPANMQIRSA